jgi:hypothetical protein
MAAMLQQMTLFILLYEEWRKERKTRVNEPVVYQGSNLHNEVREIPPMKVHG